MRAVASWGRGTGVGEAQTGKAQGQSIDSMCCTQPLPAPQVVFSDYYDPPTYAGSRLSPPGGMVRLF